jgi:hypothetical protein
VSQIDIEPGFRPWLPTLITLAGSAEEILFGERDKIGRPQHGLQRGRKA